MNRSLLFVAFFALSSAAALPNTAAAHAQAEQARGQDINKVNSAITAKAGQVYGDLSTVNGSINIDVNASVKDAKTVNGSILAKEDVQARSLRAVNGSIKLGERARVDGDIEAVNGGVFVNRGGQVARGIETANGAIEILGTELGGGIKTVNGDITVGAGSHVKGGIKVEKPKKKWLGSKVDNQKLLRVVIGPDAVVDGPLVFEREVKLYVHSSARTGSVSGATAVRFNDATPPKD